MIGFFEHQYLSYKKNHLRNLIALAKADGHLHEEEEKLLYKIGEKYGLKEKQIATLISSKEPLEIEVPESHRQKMNQLYDLVMMVHADGVVDDSEVEFCEHMVERFGFRKEIVRWVIELFERGVPPQSDEWEGAILDAEGKFR